MPVVLEDTGRYVVLDPQVVQDPAQVHPPGVVVGVGATGGENPQREVGGRMGVGEGRRGDQVGPG